jgi:hypothetical protein
MHVLEVKRLQRGLASPTVGDAVYAVQIAAGERVVGSDAV